MLAVAPGSGLDAADAANRLAEHGPNSLPEPEPPSFWRRVLVQFENPMQMLLLGAGAASLAVGQIGTFVLLVLLATLNAVLGFRQAAEAEQSVRALQGMLSPSARTLRNGEVVEVEAAELVPGDVVMLEAGDGSPPTADCCARRAWRSRSRHLPARANRHPRTPTPAPKTHR